MPISDSFAKHGIKHVLYNPLTIMECTRAVLGILQRDGQRRVCALSVAGMLVWMQAELAGDSIDNTIELMRIFIDNLQKNPKIKARA